MADEEEVTLPAVPSNEPCLPAVPSLTIVNYRKRPFLRSREPSSCEEQLAYAINTSSDPAVFSNDETPDAENYSGGVKKRKKKTYAGTWWGDELDQAKAKRSESTPDVTRKRRFRRNFDSGIFMADDSSGTDLSSDSILEQETSRVQEKQGSEEEKTNEGYLKFSEIPNSGKVHRRFKISAETALKRTSNGQSVSLKDHLVSEVVQSCLDNNDEEVDCSDMGLDHLPPVVTDLRSMIRRINNNLVEQETLAAAPFEAKLKVYLANNNFSQFPQPLLELSNIHLLSMRHNELSELPPGIRNLINLKELNISSNNLRHLPYEIFRLVQFHKLTTIRTAFNPWMSIPPVKDRLTGVPDLLLVNVRMEILRRYVISKPLEFLPNGSTKPTARHDGHRGRAAHLSEVVLRALSRHNPSNSDLSSYLTEEHPQSVRNLLGVSHTVQASGGRLCTFCNRNMVLPRYEWYEWWYVKPAGHPVPAALLQVQEPSSDADGADVKLDEATDEAAELVDVAADLEPDVPGDILTVFQRMACGCTEVKAGLEAEIKVAEESGQRLKLGQQAVL